MAFSSVKYLEQGNKIDITILEDSGHSYYSEADYTLLLKKFQQFCASKEAEK